MFATIGYEGSSLNDFVATLLAGDIDVLVDIRDRAQSRRPGFSKTALSEAVTQKGIDYIHVKALGDPKEGRDAARAGLIDEFKKIFSDVLAGEPAKAALRQIEELAQSKKICLMCYERDPRYCHRKIVAEQLEQTLGCKTVHLGVVEHGTIGSRGRRVLHSGESVTA